MLNRVVLIGRLTADPELRYTNSGTAVASFTLAVDRARPNQNGEREADFINIVAWSKLAELCGQYLKKGRLAAVDGRLQIRSYENREGQKVRVAEVVADTIRFLERGEGNGQQGQPSASTQGRPPSGGQAPAQSPKRDYGDDPFADDATSIDISDADLPF